MEKENEQCTSWGSCGASTLGVFQNQVGQVFEQLDQVKDVPVHCMMVGLKDLKGYFLVQTIR